MDTHLQRLNQLEGAVFMDAASDENAYYTGQNFGDIISAYGLGQRPETVTLLRTLQYLGTRAPSREAQKLRDMAHIDVMDCSFDEYVQGLQTTILLEDGDTITQFILQELRQLPHGALQDILVRMEELKFFDLDYPLPVYRDRIKRCLETGEQCLERYVRTMVLYAGVRNIIYALFPAKEFINVAAS